MWLKKPILPSTLLCVTALVSLSIASHSTASTKTTASIRPFNTLDAADRDVGQPMLPNIVDRNAANAQQVCPGYQISNVKRRDNVLTATLTLAGQGCNVYGNDVDSLQLVVEYQAADRLHIQIEPTYIGANNQSWFLPPDMIRKDSIDKDANRKTSDLEFFHGNDPSFWMKIVRKSNNEAIFDTSGSVFVFEDQFVEFVTALPQEYNIYGLGETIHALRLGNNFTKTMWNADSLDAVDRNIYGTHPVYYETRYYNEDGTYLARSKANIDGVTTSASHGVYYRNTHGHEILLKSDGLTWRTLGGNIDLYFYAGPTIEDATKSYQHTVGYPAMHQYWTLGYHSCSPMYSNWSQVEQSVAEYEKFASHSRRNGWILTT